MDNTALNKKSVFKCSGAIKVMSLIALICVSLGSLSYFFYYQYSGFRYSYHLQFSFPGFLSLITMLLEISPVVLFFIYVFKFYEKLKATPLVPIIFGILSVLALIKCWYSIRSGYLILEYVIDDIPTALYRIVTALFNLSKSAAFVLAFISALKGLKKKVFIIIGISLCLVSETLIIINLIINETFYYCFFHEEWLYLFTTPMSIIGWTIFYVFLLLFAVKNKIPSVISSGKKAEPVTGNPEQELKLLKTKLELEMITREEYEVLRSEIISKL